MVEHADYAAAVSLLRQQLLEYAAAVWESSAIDDAGLERLVSLMVPTVEAAQRSAAEFTSVYLAEATGSTVLPVSDAVVAGRGVAAETVYARPVITARTALAQGKSVAQAMDAGARRLQNIAGTDLQMAKVRQSDASLSHGGFRFYRRVLTGQENCALCVIASTQRYHKGKLMPIHPGCDCNTDVIPRGMDLDQVIDPQLLRDTHDQVRAFTGVADAGGRAPDYRQLIVTHEHGEVGPVLAWRGQKFTSKADIK